MKIYNIKKTAFICLLSISLMPASSQVLADKKAFKGKESTELSAGFRYSDEAVTSTSEPIISFQQNVQMLAGIDDRLTMKVYGSGRVQVHYPVYMKKAGDYEMQLDEVELTALIASMSDDGLMDFDEKATRRKMDADKKALRQKGQLHVISDVVESVIDIRLDEYQKSRSSKRLAKFHKKFRWDNLEHDAKRFKQNDALVKADRSVNHLKSLMDDSRMIKRERK